MNEEEYISGRLEDQIQWYSSKSQWNQRWFKRLRIIEIVCASAIPFLVTYIKGDTVELKIVVALLGAAIAVISSMLGIFKLEENWIQYRTSSESLKHEKFLYLTRTSPYEGESAFNLLVQRVESRVDPKVQTNLYRV